MTEEMVTDSNWTLFDRPYFFGPFEFEQRLVMAVIHRSGRECPLQKYNLWSLKKDEMELRSDKRKRTRLSFWERSIGLHYILKLFSPGIRAREDEHEGRAVPQVLPELQRVPSSGPGRWAGAKGSGGWALLSNLLWQAVWSHRQGKHWQQDGDGIQWQGI